MEPRHLSTLTSPNPHGFESINNTPSTPEWDLSLGSRQENPVLQWHQKSNYARSQSHTKPSLALRICGSYVHISACSISLLFQIILLSMTTTMTTSSCLKKRLAAAQMIRTVTACPISTTIIFPAQKIQAQNFRTTLRRGPILNTWRQRISTTMVILSFIEGPISTLTSLVQLDSLAFLRAERLTDIYLESLRGVIGGVICEFTLQDHSCHLDTDAPWFPYKEYPYNFRWGCCGAAFIEPRCHRVV